MNYLNSIQLFYNAKLINFNFVELEKYNETELNNILNTSGRLSSLMNTIIKKDIIIDLYTAINENKELKINSDDDIIVSSIKSIIRNHKANNYNVNLHSIPKSYNYIKNYNGIILTILEFFKDCPEITEKELTQLIKNLLIISPNKNNELIKINEGSKYFFNLLVLAVQKILVENNTVSLNSKERKYSPQEIADIFGVKKQTILNHINKGYISSNKYIQKGKNCKIEIFKSGVDELIVQFPKYKNRWENRFL